MCKRHLSLDDDYSEFPQEHDKITNIESVPNCQKHQGSYVGYVLVTKETKSFEDIPVT